MTVQDMIGCKIFEPSQLLALYNMKKDVGEPFNIEGFKNFSLLYEEKAKKFQEKTGVPATYFSHETNIKRFESLVLTHSVVTSYIKIKNYYGVFDGNTVSILKNGKVINQFSPPKRINDPDFIKKSNVFNDKNAQGILYGERGDGIAVTKKPFFQEGSDPTTIIKNSTWFVNKLEEIKIPNKKIEKDDEIPIEFYPNDNFFVKKTGNFYVRYYKDSIYDIVVKIRDRFFFFYDMEHIDFYTWNDLSIHLSSSYHIDGKEKEKLVRMLKLNNIFLKNNKIA